MIDPRTTDLVGTVVRIVDLEGSEAVLARGVIRVVDYNQGAFGFLIECTGDAYPAQSGKEYLSRLSAGELFQISTFDVTVKVEVEKERTLPLARPSPPLMAHAPLAEQTSPLTEKAADAARFAARAFVSRWSKETGEEPSVRDADRLCFAYEMGFLRGHGEGLREAAVLHNAMNKEVNDAE